MLSVLNPVPISVFVLVPVYLLVALSARRDQCALLCSHHNYHTVQHTTLHYTTLHYPPIPSLPDSHPH